MEMLVHIIDLGKFGLKQSVLSTKISLYSNKNISVLSSYKLKIFPNC
jgi:hypothetical protein